MEFFRRILITPGEARPRSGWRLLAHFFLLLILSPLVASILIYLARLTPALAFLADGFLVSLFVITLSVYLARRWYDRRSLRSLGLVWDAAASRDLLVGILLGGFLMALVFLAEWALGWLHFGGAISASSSSGISALGYWAAAFIMVGWYEELLTRGYWLQNLSEGLGTKWAVLISSALFGLLHIYNPNANWIAVVGIVGAGYLFAFGYLRTRQLWLPIGLHIGWNFFEGPIFSFPVSGIETAKLLNHTVSGPELFTGGAFGPEAGLILFPAMAIGAGLIFLYSKKFPKPEEMSK